LKLLAAVRWARMNNYFELSAKPEVEVSTDKFETKI
jgi:hypothetical protein